MKIDQTQISPCSLELYRESHLWYEAKLCPRILISAQSQIEAFVIFIVILLTQFPTQHRYPDMALDLWVAQIPYKAIPATGVHRGPAV